MRTAFIRRLEQLAAQDPRIFLIVGDLGYSVIEPFRDRFPDRFLNAGVAEQNMIGMAAGLALASEAIVFCYSIANFPTVRPMEQVRNDVCYHKANVKIVVVGGGFAYGSQGYTHFAVEDLALMRALPNLVVCAPADAHEARVITQLAANTPGPFYVRLGKNREPTLHESPRPFELGEMIPLEKGGDGTIFATGAIAYEALQAARKVGAETSRRFTVLSAPFLKPFNRDQALQALKGAPWAMTVEEHTGVNGLGAAVAEVMADDGMGIRLRRLAAPEYIPQSGSQEYLRTFCGIDATGIEKAIRKLIL
jgi:transketolase